MYKQDDKIQQLKQQLRDYNIATDRDLIKQLGIKFEDKEKLFCWIEYQSAFEYRKGWNEGRIDLKQQFYELMDWKEQI